MLADRLLAGVERHLVDAVDLRHELHREPRRSGDEADTAQRVVRALGRPDAAVVAGTGRLLPVGEGAGPFVALRAELDGLPVREQTALPYAATGDVMHACGHDVHLAALWAVLRTAEEVVLPVPLLGVLQPREEAGTGAPDLLSSARFTDGGVAAVVGAHVQPQLPAGVVSSAAGPVNAATDTLVITVAGRGGHAGYPHVTRDPVLALCATIVALQQVVSRRVDPRHAVAVSIGRLEAGTTNNVIPSTASAVGTMRTLEPADREPVKALLREVVEHTCAAHGCTGALQTEQHEPVLVNDAGLARAAVPWLLQAGYEVDEEFRSCGADDFSYLTEKLPGLMLFVGTGGEFGLHHPSFAPSDDTVRQVAHAYVAGYLAAADFPRDQGEIVP